jgi:hypothetical protein
VANSCRVLFSDSELSAYISEQARRHFSDPLDQADARQSAWEALMYTKTNRPKAEYQRAAYNAIHAMYERKRRIRKREILTNTFPRCT